MAPGKISYILSLFCALSSIHRANAISGGKCIDALLPVNVTAQNTQLKVSAPRNQQELTDIITRLTSETSNVTAEVTGPPATNKATYKIWTRLCVPTSQDTSKTVQLAIHGTNFDSSYWTFGGDGSKYNYVESSLKAGHAIFIYDRLGTGKSDKPDGITEVQTATDFEIAAELVKYLRAKPGGNEFNRVVGIGHSFGSAQLVDLLQKYGNILDATILTGFTAYLGGGLLTAFATDGWTIASVQNPKRFGSLPSTYIVTEGIVNVQQHFFRYGGYDSAVLEAVEATKATATLGEILTPLGGPALNYTNPVLVVTGDKDYGFCGGNCYQMVNGVNLVESTKRIFPGVTSFSTYIPANTGHGLNLHLSAPETFSKIQEWISRL
ncbi:Alpha/beta hydrolase family-domain-containing protein [Ephemerocybe angulata]|uniref:Alpha/beta hydrolase family-domain-containing protein n=1 Tax=Ephemerocybe angulata TaxID=980116 RepID=A0A8H6HU54_9AGAR|nr:Alpha/beta hydrolase family-domain-containing protein [Tulosesus angulatus]